MTQAPYWHDEASAVYIGDARNQLAGMPDGSVDCVVTSPPYWGKRDYGVAGQYGQEPIPQAYIRHLCGVFDQVRRGSGGGGAGWLLLSAVHARVRGSDMSAASVPAGTPDT